VSYYRHLKRVRVVTLVIFVVAGVFSAGIYYRGTHARSSTSRIACGSTPAASSPSASSIAPCSHLAERLLDRPLLPPPRAPPRSPPAPTSSSPPRSSPPAPPAAPAASKSLQSPVPDLPLQLLERHPEQPRHTDKGECRLRGGECGGVACDALARITKWFGNRDDPTTLVMRYVGVFVLIHTPSSISR
jgi:hypothetical protein